MSPENSEQFGSHNLKQLCLSEGKFRVWQIGEEGKLGEISQVNVDEMAGSLT